MSPLTEFVFVDLPRRAAERGAGLIIFLLASYFFLSEQVFSEVIVTLAIVEFYFGFLLPTLRAIGVSGRGSKESRLAFFLIIFLPVIVCIVLFSNHLPSSILAVAVIIITPLILEAKIALEKKDIKLAIKVDTQGPMLGAMLGALVLAACYHVEVLSDFGSPVIRPVLGLVAQGFLLGWPWHLLILEKFSFNLKNTFMPLSGIDFGVLLIAIRISLLNMLNQFPDGALAVKFVTIIYEPVASVLGLLLRFINSRAKFIGSNYALLSRWCFVVQALGLIATLMLVLFHNETFAAALFTICYLLLVVSSTTHFIFSMKLTKTSIIILQSCSILVCSFMVYKNAALIITFLALASIWLMHNRLTQVSRGK